MSGVDRAISDDEVLELLERTGEQYDEYLRLACVADVANLAGQASDELLIDTQRHPIGLVLNTGG